MNNQYNGHKNIQTWNVSLWINNDEGFYSMTQNSENYKDFTDQLIEMGITSTPDEYSWSNEDLDYKALNELINYITE